MSHDVETNDPSRRRSTSSVYMQPLHYSEVMEDEKMPTNGLSIIPVPPGEDVVELVLAHSQRRILNLAKYPAHLFQAVDDKAVRFHDRPDLCRQRAQQLTSSFLLLCIGHR
jgi:hypothetical protein